jgi:glycosyltransferase involved in cell wall biosynthesis
MKKPLISICIPAYKNTEFVQRLLNSILIQTFRNFEVIITDDSPSDEVESIVRQYQNKFSILYQRNRYPLGSPKNWNTAMLLAKGQWIKIMHDDDWFADKTSLLEFANAITKNINFIFSGHNVIDVDTNSRRTVVISRTYLRLLKKSPLTLLKENFIGHPSTTLIKNDGNIFYDENSKWVVDIEFYIRFLNEHKNFLAIQKPLVNIGKNEFQITKQSFRNPEIEIPEVLYLFYKLPRGSLKNIFAYDYFWRFVRNMSIRSEDDIKKYLPEARIPDVISKIIRLQSKFASSLLRNGVISKSLMLSSYFSNFRSL